LRIFVGVAVFAVAHFSAAKPAPVAQLVATPASAASAKRAAMPALTPQIIASFDAFYRGAYPERAAPQARLLATADGVTATVDMPPQRGFGALCRMERQRFAIKRTERGAHGWHALDSEQFAWLGRAANCTPSPLVVLGAAAAPVAATAAAAPVAAVASSAPINMRQPLPDVDLIPLLEQAAPLLTRARLLFSGNTSCAPMRSLPFTLSGIGVGAPIGRAEVMLELRFDSDRKSVATVWVRKRGADLTAWDVACAPVPATPG
jgi:hypothetical protein